MDGYVLVAARWVDLEFTVRAQGSAQALRRRDRTAALRARGFELRDGAEQVLEAHPALRPLLHEAAVKLRELFGQESTFALERVVDPEAHEDEEPRLFLLVKTTLDADTAHALLTQFDESWWADNAARGSHRMQVSVEFL